MFAFLFLSSVQPEFFSVSRDRIYLKYMSEMGSFSSKQENVQKALGGRKDNCQIISIFCLHVATSALVQIMRERKGIRQDSIFQTGPEINKLTLGLSHANKKIMMLYMMFVFFKRLNFYGR